MNFMKTVLNIDSSQVDGLLGIALLMGTPFFVIFGWLSDKLGRKSIMMTGNGYGSAAPDKNSHKHPMAFANLGLHPASQMVQTVFKQFLQK